VGRGQERWEVREGDGWRGLSRRHNKIPNQKIRFSELEKGQERGDTSDHDDDDDDDDNLRAP